jgi:hypothetical protein
VIARRLVFVLWFALRFVVHSALLFTPACAWMAGFPFAGAGSDGCGFFDISICTGSCL